MKSQTWVETVAVADQSEIAGEKGEKLLIIPETPSLDVDDEVDETL